MQSRGLSAALALVDDDDDEEESDHSEPEDDEKEARRLVHSESQEAHATLEGLQALRRRTHSLWGSVTLSMLSELKAGSTNNHVDQELRQLQETCTSCTRAAAIVTHAHTKPLLRLLKERRWSKAAKDDASLRYLAQQYRDLAALTSSFEVDVREAAKQLRQLQDVHLDMIGTEFKTLHRELDRSVSAKTKAFVFQKTRSDTHYQTRQERTKYQLEQEQSNVITWAEKLVHYFGSVHRMANASQADEPSLDDAVTVTGLTLQRAKRCLDELRVTRDTSLVTRVLLPLAETWSRHGSQHKAFHRHVLLERKRLQDAHLAARRAVEDRARTLRDLESRTQDLEMRKNVYFAQMQRLRSTQGAADTKRLRDACTQVQAEILKLQPEVQNAMVQLHTAQDHEREAVRWRPVWTAAPPPIPTVEASLARIASTAHALQTLGNELRQTSTRAEQVHRLDLDSQRRRFCNKHERQYACLTRKHRDMEQEFVRGTALKEHVLLAKVADLQESIQQYDVSYVGHPRVGKDVQQIGRWLGDWAVECQTVRAAYLRYLEHRHVRKWLHLLHRIIRAHRQQRRRSE